MRRAAIRLAVAAIAAAALMTGCTSDQGPVCDSLDAVRHSADQLRNANISENGLSVVSSGLNQLRANLDQFSADAKVQLQPQVDAVRSTVDQLQLSVATAKA